MRLMPSTTNLRLLPVKPEGGGLLGVCHSVRLSVLPSVRPSVFQSTRGPSTRFSGLFWVVLWIFTWNLVYEFVFTWYRSSLSFVMLDLLLQELLPFAKIYFSGLFSAIFWDIDMKFGIWICHDILRSSRLTYFYRSYCPLLKFSFPDFSLLSFAVFNWNLVFEYIFTVYRSSLSFVKLDLLFTGVIVLF